MIYSVETTLAPSKQKPEIAVVVTTKIIDAFLKLKTKGESWE